MHSHSLANSLANRLANREELHQRVLQRLANLRRLDVAEMANPKFINDPNDFEDEPAWMTANIPKTVAELRARSGFTTAQAGEDTPPF